MGNQVDAMIGNCQLSIRPLKTGIKRIFRGKRNRASSNASKQSNKHSDFTIEETMSTGYSNMSSDGEFFDRCISSVYQGSHLIPSAGGNYLVHSRDDNIVDIRTYTGHNFNRLRATSSQPSPLELQEAFHQVFIGVSAGTTSTIHFLLHQYPQLCNKLNETEKCVVKSHEMHLTPLHLAASGGYRELTLTLSSYSSVNVNAVCVENGFAALHFSVMLGQLRSTEALLANSRVDVNARDHQGKTALHIAVENKNVDVTLLLLKVDQIDVWDENGADKYGDTVFHIAAKYPHVQIINALFSYTLSSLRGRKASSTTLSTSPTIAQNISTDTLEGLCTVSRNKGEVTENSLREHSDERVINFQPNAVEMNYAATGETSNIELVTRISVSSDFSTQQFGFSPDALTTGESPAITPPVSPIIIASSSTKPSPAMMRPGQRGATLSSEEMTAINESALGQDGATGSCAHAIISPEKHLRRARRLRLAGILWAENKDGHTVRSILRSLLMSPSTDEDTVSQATHCLAILERYTRQCDSSWAESISTSSGFSSGSSCSLSFPVESSLARSWPGENSSCQYIPCSYSPDSTPLTHRTVQYTHHRWWSHSSPADSSAGANVDGRATGFTDGEAKEEEEEEG